MIWMTAAIDTPATEEQKKARIAKNTGDQPLNVAAQVDFYVLGVEQASGKLVVNQKVHTVNDPQWIHTLNSYASPTPVIENGILYCHFGAWGNVAFDTVTKQVTWMNQDFQINHENGPGSTPIIWKDLFIFHCDGSDQQYLVALNKSNGKLAWKTDRTGKLNNNPQLKKAYGTPIITTLPVDGKPTEVMISPAADWLYCYNPANGKELWKLNYGVLGFSIVPRPVLGHGMIYMCTTFMKSELLAIKIDEQSGQPTISWRHKKSVPNMPSPLLVGEEIYIVHDNGVATCLNALTGEEIWTERLGGKYCASPLYVDGKILLSNRDGDTLVIEPGKKFQKVATNHLPGEIMASPIAVGNAIYIRTDKELFRIESKQ